MTPRNDDENSTYRDRKKKCPIKCDEDTTLRNLVPCIQHKKHKVVKLVKSQLQKIHDEGLLCRPETFDIFFEDEKKDESEFVIIEPDTTRRIRRSDMEEGAARFKYGDAGSAGHPASAGRTGSAGHTGSTGHTGTAGYGASTVHTENAIHASHSLTSRKRSGCLSLFWYLLGFLILLFIIVWVSAGPLSNYQAISPIPTGSFVHTDKCSSLEKKYLLRWGKPEHE